MRLFSSFIVALFIAFSTVAFASIQAGVRAVVEVPLWAASSQHTLDAASTVLSVGDQLQVFRPDAVAVSAASLADVIPDQPHWWLANEKVMRLYQFVFNPEAPVTAFIKSPEPQGTAVSPTWIDLRPKALFRGKLGKHREPILSGVTRPDVDASRPHFIGAKEVAGVAPTSARSKPSSLLDDTSRTPILPDLAPPLDPLYGLRVCESNNDYTANTGNGFYGAYQFSISTWYAVGGTGYPHLALPEEQDARAWELLTRYGPQHWPVCQWRLQ